MRTLLQGQSPAIVAGCHDALGGKLVESAGFDAAWLSGFALSAALRCMPDAGLLTLTEVASVARAVAAAVRIPLIVDGDTGFGGILNIRRAVQELEDAGVAALSLEDNDGHKKNSFYDGVERQLLAPRDMQAKIRAAKAAQRSSDFVVIARTEALIAGQPVDEALDRAKAYRDAGADLLLIHSRQWSLLQRVADRWDGSAPLAVIPTQFMDTPRSQLVASGFRVVIYAHQAVLAAVLTMKKMLAALREESVVDDMRLSMSTFEDVQQLVDVAAHLEFERRFLPVSNGGSLEVQSQRKSVSSFALK
ncbi:MAG: isocitrate lyase/PEP mutase family protein [Candidatus Eisenbacteria bacterium]|nr:isocitrate lyase/PEP mutase family protein [Candidatus Eisenbacteria bacterium]